MSKNILYLHHFEPYWEEGLNNNGTSFEKQLDNILDFLYFNEKKYDEIIITTFEDLDLSPEHERLINYCNTNQIQLSNHVYGYGFTRELDDEDSLLNYPEEELGTSWCYGNRIYHGEEDILVIEDWQHDLKGNQIDLGGAFEGECLNDAQTIMDTLNIEYTNIESLMVGTGIEYESNIEKIIDNETTKLNEETSVIEDKIDKAIVDKKLDDFEELMEKYPHIALKHVRALKEKYHDYLEKLDEYSELGDKEYFTQTADINFSYEKSQELFDEIIYEYRNRNEKTDIEKEILVFKNLKSKNSFGMNYEP